MLALKFVALACLAAVAAGASVPTLASLTLADRVPSDPNPTGFGKIFVVNGVSSPNYQMTVGQSITFSIPAPTNGNLWNNHDVSIFTDPNNGGSTTGLVTRLIDPTGAPTITNNTWTPTTAGNYWYGCSKIGHFLMGNYINVTAASTPTETNSICDRYTRALFTDNTAANQAALITAIVTRAVVGSTEGSVPVEGIINLEAQKPFFNGSINYRYAGGPNGAAAAPNFYTNTAEFNALAGKLVGFFGIALNCTLQGTTGFPAYSGSADMTAIHKNMPITNAIFTQFNGQIAKTAISFNVATADVNAVGALLSSFNRGAFNADGTPVTPADATSIICNQADCPCESDQYDPANGCKLIEGGSAASTVQAITFASVFAVLLALVARQ